MIALDTKIVADENGVDSHRNINLLGQKQNFSSVNERLIKKTKCL